MPAGFRRACFESRCHASAHARPQRANSRHRRQRKILARSCSEDYAYDSAPRRAAASRRRWLRRWHDASSSFSTRNARDKAGHSRYRQHDAHTTQSIAFRRIYRQQAYGRWWECPHTPGPPRRFHDMPKLMHGIDVVTWFCRHAEVAISGVKNCSSFKGDARIVMLHEEKQKIFTISMRQLPERLRLIVYNVTSAAVMIRRASRRISLECFCFDSFLYLRENMMFLAIIACAGRATDDATGIGSPARFRRRGFHDVLLASPRMLWRRHTIADCVRLAICLHARPQLQARGWQLGYSAYIMGASFTAGEVTFSKFLANSLTTIYFAMPPTLATVMA